MKVRVRNPRDLGAGAIFLLFGVGAMVIGRNYPMGSAFNMGPGYFPVLLGALLALLGVVVGARGFLLQGEPVEAIGLRALILVLGAVGAFALTIDSLGLVVATVSMVVIGALASPESRWREVVIVAIALLALAVGAFAYALGLPFKILPF